MQAAVLRELGQPLSLQDLAIPQPAAGRVRIRVEACGVCHSDLHLARGDWESLRRYTKLPLVLGHEIAGVIDAVGDGVTDLHPGDRVGVPWIHWTCGDCEYCRIGRETLCTRQQITGLTVDGGFAEYLTAPASHVARLPDALTAFEAAPLMCAGLTAYKALKTAAITPGQSLAIYGIGGLGHLAIQLARARGLDCCAVDIAADKLRLARESGAAETVNLSEGAKPPKVDVALVCSASVDAYLTALAGLRRAGTLVIVGMPAQPIPFPAVKLVAGEIRILSSAIGTRADLAELLHLAAATGIRCHSHPRPLAEAPAALDALARGEVTGRTVLYPAIAL